MTFIDWSGASKTSSLKGKKDNELIAELHLNGNGETAAPGSYSDQFTGGHADRPAEEVPSREGGSYSDQFSFYKKKPNGKAQEPERAEEITAEPPKRDPQYDGLWKLLQKRRGSVSADELPRLSKKMETRLAQSSKELSLVEGSIIAKKSDVKTIYVTSCFHGEGRSTASLHTAYGLAVYRGRRVLLVDTNRESPRIHRYFNTSNEPNLQTLLEGSTSPVFAIAPTVYQNLYILPAGADRPIQDFPRLQEVLNGLKLSFDFVVVDGVPVLASFDLANLSQSIDGVLLVIECEKTKWEVVQMVEGKIKGVGGNLLGVVLNKRKYYIPPWAYKILSR